MSPRRSEIDKADKDKTFQFALQSITRKKILTHLAEVGGSTQTELSEIIHHSPSTARYHLRVLEQVGLVNEIGTRMGPNGITERLFDLTGEIEVLKGPADGAGEMFSHMIEALRVGAKMVEKDPEAHYGGTVYTIDAPAVEVSKALAKIDKILRSVNAKKQNKTYKKNLERRFGAVVAFFPDTPPAGGGNGEVTDQGVLKVNVGK